MLARGLKPRPPHTRISSGRASIALGHASTLELPAGKGESGHEHIFVYPKHRGSNTDVRLSVESNEHLAPGGLPSPRGQVFVNLHRQR